jgi:hypothetical protein
VTVEVRATRPASPPLTRYSLLKEFKAHPKGKAFYPQLAGAFGLGNPDGSTERTPNLTPEEAAAKKKADLAVSAFLDDMPVYKIHAFSEGRSPARSVTSTGLLLNRRRPDAMADPRGSPRAAGPGGRLCTPKRSRPPSSHPQVFYSPLKVRYVALYESEE